MNISKLDINGRQQLIGIDDELLIFHFCTKETRQREEICDYRLVIKQDNEVVWDSQTCPYQGETSVYYKNNLLPKTQYQATLRINYQIESEMKGINQKAVESTIHFETGFMHSPWQATWIEPRQETAIEEKQLPFFELLVPNIEFWGGEKRLKPVKLLKKPLPIKKEVKSARLYVSAHGVYQAYLNETKISNHRFAPENSAYEKILYYQTYDITDNLERENNCLFFLLGDGWWIGRLGLSGDSCNYGNKLGLIFQVEITYVDGTTELILSDETVSAKDSHIQYSDLYIGEKQDLSQIEEMNILKQESNNWDNCIATKDSTNMLIGQLLDPVQVLMKLPSEDIFYTPNGELVVDFHQVVAGVARLRVRGKKNQQITVEHAEILDQNGNFITNIIGRNKDQKDVFLCKEGVQILEPVFTYHGFRYIKLTGIAKEDIEDATALVMGSLLNQIGQFECSNEDINQLQQNIEWSTRGNMFSIPTDCPQREKLGWTGDIQVFAKTGCFNFDLRAFLGAWLKNLRAEQGDDGEVPVVVPNPKYQEALQRKLSEGQNSSAGWGDACVLVPYYLYLSYKEIYVLEENYPAMVKWITYVQDSCSLKPEGYGQMTKEEQARNPYLWTKQYHFGDWLIPSLRSLPDGVQRGTKETADVVGSCFYAITLEAFTDICRILNKQEEVSRYSKLLVKVRRAIKEEFVLDNGSICGRNLQGLYVMILKAKVVEGPLKEKVVEHLVTLIEENGGCLDTGFASVSYLLDVLYENGKKEIAYQLLFQKKSPSWLYMVSKGATTIWENWMAVLDNGTPTESSYNHYAFGCVGEWIYRHIGGIQMEAPGYEKIVFAPDLSCGLSFAKTSIETPYGLCELQWQKKGEVVCLTGRVPIGTSARVMLNQQEASIKPGDFSLEIKIK